jgi:hypothetical protein
MKVRRQRGHGFFPLRLVCNSWQFQLCMRRESRTAAKRADHVLIPDNDEFVPRPRGVAADLPAVRQDDGAARGKFLRGNSETLQGGRATIPGRKRR